MTRVHRCVTVTCMKKAIAYIRVSSDSQEDNTSLEAQKLAIAAYAVSHGFEIIQTCKDVDSGANEFRQGLSALRDLIKTVSFDAVIVSKIDRFTRDVELGERVRKEIEASKGQLVSVNEAFDTKSPIGLAFVQMAQVFSALERNTIRERFKNGKTHTVTKKGGWLGGTAPIGYSSTGNKNALGAALIINEEEAEIVKRCFDFRQQNLSFSEIAEQLNKLGFKTRKGNNFDKTGVFRIIKREAVYKQEKSVNSSYRLDCAACQPRII